MKLCDFEGLCQEEKVSMLYRKGVYVGKGRKDQWVTVLYQVDSFYVEVFYTRYRYSIKALRCFDATDELDPYIDQIVIEPLVYP
jgi:hypothetical protein